MPLWRLRAGMALANVEGFPTEQANFERVRRLHALPGRERNVLLNVPGFGLGESTRFLCHSIDLHAHECICFAKDLKQDFLETGETLVLLCLGCSRARSAIDAQHSVIVPLTQQFPRAGEISETDLRECVRDFFLLFSR